MDGVEVSEEEDEEEVEGAVGGEEVMEETHFFSTESRKVVGRSRRKMQQAAKKIEVPVELHVPKESDLHMPRGQITPRSPRPAFDLPPSGHAPYEDLHRQARNEHAYEGTRMGPVHSPRNPDPRDMSSRSPQGRDQAYEEMNINRQYNRQASPHGVPSPNGPSGVGAPKSPMSLDLPRTPGYQSSQYSLSSQAPYMAHSPNTPVSPGQYGSDDRYNMDNVNTSKPSAKTYLTDDDDGGFSQRTPHRPQNGNDNNYNKKSEPDRYGNGVYNRGGYPPSERHNNTTHDYGMRGQNPQSGQRSLAASRDNLAQSGHPVSATQAFHRQQGSGRSDTSASDSGFGEIDYAPVTSKQGPNSYHNSAYGNTVLPSAVKSPYYNHAYEHDPPEDDDSVDDIMAKHKALAAKMFRQNESVPNGNSNYNPRDRYNDPKYTQKLNKRQDGSSGPGRDRINSNSRLLSDSQQMEESFI